MHVAVVCALVQLLSLLLLYFWALYIKLLFELFDHLYALILTGWWVHYLVKSVRTYIYTHIHTYRVSQEECARLREGVPYVKVRVYRYNPKHLCPKLNVYGDKGAWKVWSSCGSTYCTWFTWRNTHTLRIVRPCLQQAQARSSLRLHM